MAKKNGRDDPPKPQVAENEQMSDGKATRL